MPRPEKFEDLPKYERQDHEIASINLREVTQVSTKLGMALLGLLDAAERGGYIVDRTSGFDRATLFRPQSEEERKRALESAQSLWNKTHSRYLAAVSDPSSVTEEWIKQSVDRHAEDEGLAPIDWSTKKEDVA